MRVPKIAFLAAGLSGMERGMIQMGVPVNGPSLESVQSAWNERLEQIAAEAIPGSIQVGELAIGNAALTLMVKYEVEK